MAPPPSSAPAAWRVKSLVFDDGPGCIAIALLENEGMVRLGIRWNENQTVRRPVGSDYKATSVAGGPTEWFVLPAELAGPVGRHLLVKQGLGVRGFCEEGLRDLVRELIETEDVSDGISY